MEFYVVPKVIIGMNNKLVYHLVVIMIIYNMVFAQECLNLHPRIFNRRNSRVDMAKIMCFQCTGVAA